MAKYKEGPRGGVLKVTQNGKTETYRYATQADIPNMPTRLKTKFATRIKGRKSKI